MKKRTKVLLGVLLVLLAAVAAVAFWQRDNLLAVKTSATTSREDLASRMEENDKKIAESAQSVEGVTVRDLTEEEKQALRAGELDEKELVERLITPAEEDAAPPKEETAQQPSGEKPAAAEPPKTTEQQDPPAQSQPAEASSAEKALSECLAEIYLMKAEYTAWLEDKNQAAIDEYVALEESQRTTAAKYSIGMRCLREALEKEKECDARMEAMKEKIRGLLDEMGRDHSLIEQIEAAYAEEKELKKAYFLGLH